MRHETWKNLRTPINSRLPTGKCGLVKNCSGCKETATENRLNNTTEIRSDGKNGKKGLLVMPHLLEEKNRPQKISVL